MVFLTAAQKLPVTVNEFPPQLKSALGIAFTLGLFQARPS